MKTEKTVFGVCIPHADDVCCCERKFFFGGFLGRSIFREAAMTSEEDKPDGPLSLQKIEIVHNTVGGLPWTITDPEQDPTEMKVRRSALGRHLDQKFYHTPQDMSIARAFYQYGTWMLAGAAAFLFYRKAARKRKWRG